MIQGGCNRVAKYVMMLYKHLVCSLLRAFAGPENHVTLRGGCGVGIQA
jgi:hypothetical protein